MPIEVKHGVGAGAYAAAAFGGSQRQAREKLRQQELEYAEKRRAEALQRAFQTSEATKQRKFQERQAELGREYEAQQEAIGRQFEVGKTKYLTKIEEQREAERIKAEKERDKRLHEMGQKDILLTEGLRGRRAEEEEKRRIEAEERRGKAKKEEFYFQDYEKRKQEEQARRQAEFEKKWEYVADEEEAKNIENEMRVLEEDQRSASPKFDKDEADRRRAELEERARNLPQTLRRRRPEEPKELFSPKEQFQMQMEMEDRLREMATVEDPKTGIKQFNQKKYDEARAELMKSYPKSIFFSREGDERYGGDGNGDSGISGFKEAVEREASLKNLGVGTGSTLEEYGISQGPQELSKEMQIGPTIEAEKELGTVTPTSSINSFRRLQKEKGYSSSEQELDAKEFESNLSIINNPSNSRVDIAEAIEKNKRLIRKTSIEKGEYSKKQKENIKKKKRSALEAEQELLDRELNPYYGLQGGIFSNV